MISGNRRRKALHGEGGLQLPEGLLTEHAQGLCWDCGAWWGHHRGCWIKKISKVLTPSSSSNCITCVGMWAWRGSFRGRSRSNGFWETGQLILSMPKWRKVLTLSQKATPQVRDFCIWKHNMSLDLDIYIYIYIYIQCIYTVYRVCYFPDGMHLVQINVPN